MFLIFIFNKTSVCLRAIDLCGVMGKYSVSVWKRADHRSAAAGSGGGPPDI
jgi:hypothetical protein